MTVHDRPDCLIGLPIEAQDRQSIHCERPTWGTVTTTDIHAAAARLAADSRLTDYDLWRTLQNIEREISRIIAARQPVPITILRGWRPAAGAGFRLR